MRLQGGIATDIRTHRARGGGHGCKEVKHLVLVLFFAHDFS